VAKDESVGQAGPQDGAKKPHSGQTRIGQGWVADLTDEKSLRDALERAFDYRGDVALTMRDGSRIEGYLFDRSSDSPALAECYMRLMAKEGGSKITAPYSQIARIEFTGRDTAAGKSFETWIKNYLARKKAGEKNIALEPEKLD
jgi:hypothetical protein